jgi:RNA polymerase sigma-70 factor, ECF subfamily
VTELDDVALVRRVQQGDLGAFEPLYRRHAGRMYALCLRLTGDPAAAAERVQDVFVRAWERIRSFRGDSAFTSWLHRLAVNVVLQEMRSTRRREARIMLDDTPGAPAPGMRSDEYIDLDTAISRLPPGARVVFVLHDIEGYSHDEIAGLLGRASGTVRSQLWKARQTLMATMAGHLS